MKNPFEITQEQAANNTLKNPSVSMENTNLDYFGYQLANHKFTLKSITN